MFVIKYKLYINYSPLQYFSQHNVTNKNSFGLNSSAVMRNTLKGAVNNENSEKLKKINHNLNFQT